MDFWTRLDILLASKALIIDRPKGSAHPRYPTIVYPLDYGYLKETCAGDGDGIDVWRGTLAHPHLVGIVCTVDTKKSDTEVKLLVGCNAQEMQTVHQFHNGNAYMSGIIIRRGKVD